MVWAGSPQLALNRFLRVGLLSSETQAIVFGVVELTAFGFEDSKHPHTESPDTRTTPSRVRAPANAVRRNRKLVTEAGWLPGSHWLAGFIDAILGACCICASILLLRVTGSRYGVWGRSGVWLGCGLPESTLNLMSPKPKKALVFNFRRSRTVWL